MIELLYESAVIETITFNPEYGDPFIYPEWDPDTYAEPFAREWSMLAQYRDYCDRTTRNLRESLSRGPVTPSQRSMVRQRTRELAEFDGLLQWMTRACAPRAPRRGCERPSTTMPGPATTWSARRSATTITAFIRNDRILTAPPP